ncbi:hypothetical protein WICMUC_002108 [Wickerhamomyces mucosus]|uniref:F-box domain-containing protein n=1 Tax=Wickerhamomyces mucosus TaxID=1378264 RepID=A0A9P8PQN6_9ASCO|nr:hypothetical protein WICMUC_002108 [Wickerhamomyces mucosus]
MANKRRPKKTKPPYRRYGPGVANKNGASENDGTYQYGNDSDEDEETEAEASATTVVKKNIDINEKDEDSSSQLWPISQFQKIDVLKIAIINEKIKNGEIIEFPVNFNDSRVKTNSPIFPIELFYIIFKFQDRTNPKYLRLSKLFYQLYSPILYERPILDSHNFFSFVETITSKKKYGSLVRFLDLSPIIQSGKNSYVSKVLRRCSPSLEVFVAPQTSFGFAPLVSLRSCNKIKVLDLGLVSETVNLKELFYSIRNAKELTHLSFPRSSISCEDYQITEWPPNLWYLRLSGGITDDFLINSKFPNTISRLEFAHCPQIKEFAIYNFLSKFGDTLTHLSIQYPMPGLSETAMDFLFTYCPNLKFLQITVDYCSRFLFAEDLLPHLPNGKERPLRTLWIESSGGLGQSSKIHPDDLIIALMENRLPCLKNVRITSKLGWDLHNEDVETLADLLEEKDGGLFLNYY